MDSRCLRTWLAATVAALTPSGLGHAYAQGPARGEVLTMPPPATGACVAAPHPARDPRRWWGRRLVLAGPTPTGRREGTIHVDSTGRTFNFGDGVWTTRHPGTELGGGVMAMFAADGQWHGTWVRYVKHVATNRRGPDGRSEYLAPTRGDRTVERGLTAAEQARVGELAAWMRTRCPA